MRRIGLAISLAAIALLSHACGGTEQTETTEAEVAIPAQPSLDPALASSAASRSVAWPVYTPLLSYRHAEGDEGRELIPGLAGDLPEVSEDGRTYSLTLREGLSYSDGSAVAPSDFEHAIARVLTLGSRTARRFEGIVGAPGYADAGGPGGDIRGIRADRKTREITIRLRAPDRAFGRALALPAAGLVPQATPFRDLSNSPPPGVGPYELVDVDPGQGFVLHRSETFPDLDIPDIPTGNIERITFRIETGETQPALDDRIDPSSVLRQPVIGEDYASFSLEESG